MATGPFDQFKIPNEMRDLAEQSVEQARKAFDGFMGAASLAAKNLQGQAATATSITQKAVGFAETNVAASFELAQKLLQAKDAAEVVQLQKEYLERQTRALTEQARELAESAAAMAKESYKSAD